MAVGPVLIRKFSDLAAEFIGGIMIIKWFIKVGQGNVLNLNEWPRSWQSQPKLDSHTRRPIYCMKSDTHTKHCYSEPPKLDSPHTAHLLHEEWHTHKHCYSEPPLLAETFCFGLTSAPHNTAAKAWLSAGVLTRPCLWRVSDGTQRCLDKEKHCVCGSAVIYEGGKATLTL